ncbi:MAG TPA: flagellar basal body-associated protein FliL [Rhodanobacteraceae bacterium]|nr:flagellar basal body-associated protein FliL [Rhodanobacteraceae bacterium]
MKVSQSGRATLWIIIALVAVIVLGAGGVGGWLLLGNRAGTAHAASAPPPPAKPVFFQLDPFTVNLQQTTSDGGQLLYVGITLQLGDATSQAFLQEHLPQVRDRLLLVLSGQTAGNLITSAGKEHLAAEIRGALVKPFGAGQPKLAVNHVLFTQFIVQ